MKKRPASRSKNQTTKWPLKRPAFFLLVIGCISIVWASGLFSTEAPFVAAQSEDDRPKVRPEPGQTKIIDGRVIKQIEALQREKESRTPAQRKIDSQLLYKAMMSAGRPIASDVPVLETRVEVDQKGYVAVEISANVTKRLLDRLRSMNAEIVSSFPEYKSITASIPLSEVENLALEDDVIFIQPHLDAMTNKGEPPVAVDPSRLKSDNAPAKPFFRPNPPVTFERRAAKVREYLAGALARRRAGSVVAQSDRTHRADAARTIFGTDGTGIRIGVLSDGVTSLAARQATGDLPAGVTVLPGQAGTGDEGTAMLEIIHDVAPGAQLYFATAFTSITSFANNIRALRTAGCDIIIDDITYFVETPFQDGQGPAVISPGNAGVVVQAVKDVTIGSQAGALYFSSAGNSGNRNDNTSGAWEGDFVDGGVTAAPLPVGNRLHDFGGGNTSNVLTVGGRVLLKWSDPLGGSGNDYDVFALNNAGTAIVTAGTNIQDGNDDPVEDIGNRATGQRIVIVKKAAAAARFLHLNTNRGRLTFSTAGVVYGHNASRDAISLAATPAGPAQNNLAVGPFPRAHSALNVVEQFSSDGPRRIFYNGDGTLITPGNVSSTGGSVLQKPDITAADGVATTTPGFIPFFGTSASAPQAGAMMALMKAASPGSTNTQLYNAMISTAIDIEAAGTDRDSGAGIFMPIPAISALGVPGPAYLEVETTTAAEAPGNANGRLEAGEGVTLNVTLNNIGPSGATTISGTLTTTTPGVFISNPNSRAYPNIAALTGNGTNVTPWRFTLGDSFVCGTRIDFTLTVDYQNGVGPQTFTFSVNSDPPVNVPTTLDTTAPPANPAYTATTGAQTGRLFRDGIPSTCASPKANPGLGATTTGARQYDAYVFTAANSGCITVTLTSGSAAGLFSVAYNSSGFVPATPNVNYLADAGGSNITTSYAFNVTAGQQFTIVVHEVNTGGGIGVNYTLNVNGSIRIPCSNPNRVPTAVAQNVTVNTGAGCTADVPPSAVNNGSSDPDGPGDITSIFVTPASPYPIGVNNVILTVRDSQGAESQANATITVNNPAPVLGVYPNTLVNAGGNTTVTPSAAPTDNGSVSTLTAAAPGFTGTLSGNPATGVITVTGAAPPGIYTVTVTVTDNCGRTSTATFQLTVNSPPTITAAGPLTRTQGVAATVSQIASVNDPDQTENTLAVTVNGGASATVNGVTVSAISVNAAGQVSASVGAACGATNASFTLRVTDDNGAFAQATLVVNVLNETVPPVIAPYANVVATLPNGSATSMPVFFPLPTATDNCSTPTVTTNPVSGSVFPLGSTTVTITAVDANGNTSTATFTVTVWFPFTGFTGRVANPPAINFTWAGNNIPIQFSLGGDRGLNIFAAGSPSSQQVNCLTGTPTGGILPAVSSFGLYYFGGQYYYYWTTDTAWAGTCRKFSMTFTDGTTRTLDFWFYNAPGTSQAFKFGRRQINIVP